ncbi:MAG: hypothetical protein QW620_03450 [Thermoplasmata archaeon]
MIRKYLGSLIVVFVVTVILFLSGHSTATNLNSKFVNTPNIYQTGENDTGGNPFENFTPEQLFDPASPMAILGYLSMFFCLTIPISLLIIAIATLAIFVRMGKIKKELSQLNQSRQQAPAHYVQPQFVQHPQPATTPTVQPHSPQAPQQPPQQSPQSQQVQGQQGKQF